MTEYCNEKDDDCDGLVDELLSEDPDSPAQDTVLFYTDADGDGFGVLGSEANSYACPNSIEELGSLIADNNEDCDDDNAEINPDADEICDEEVDRNCDGKMTLGAVDPKTWYVDSDKDGFGDANVSFEACTAPLGFIEDNTDCNDLDDDANPDADELCDGKLTKCGSEKELVEDTVTGKVLPYDEWDDDGDGFVECDLSVNLLYWESSQVAVDISTNAVSGLLGGKDCDDTRDFVYPSAPETCNGQHDDCEEQLRLGGIPDDEGDLDNDGFIACERTEPLPLNEEGEPDWFGTDPSVYLELIDGGYYPIGGDCRLDDEFTYPGAAYLTSETDCLRDAAGVGGVGDPDGYSDCVFTQCDYGVFLTANVGPDFVLIEGDDLIDPLGRYTIPHAFYIMTTEVTQAMYQEITGTNPSYYVGNNHPVNRVSWYDAVAYANALSEDQGIEMCYTCTDTNNVQPCVESVDFSDYYECEGYTLPNEHEWELAARSGTTKDFWTGEGDDLGGNYSANSCDARVTIQDGVNNPLLSEYAWFCGNTGFRVKAVGTRLPNGFGLYDMHGNVREWNSDRFGCSFPYTNAYTCVQSGSSRVIRGGAFDDHDPSGLRASDRDDPRSEYHLLHDLGFRLRRRAP